MKKFNGVWQPGQPRVEIDYNKVNKKFLKSDEAWETFKIAPVYNGVVGGDSRTKELGQAYVNAIIEEFPHLTEELDKFARNDELGSPFIHEYNGIRAMSPGTLIYMYTLGDIERQFGKLNAWTNIVEIGPGYGGLCIISLLHKAIESYTLIDLPTSLKVIQKYINGFPDLLENTSVAFHPTTSVPETESFSIAISSFCLSELDDKGIDFYLDNVISKSENCYIESNLMCTPVVARRNQGRHDSLITKLEKLFKTVDIIDYPTELSNGYNVHKIIGKN